LFFIAFFLSVQTKHVSETVNKSHPLKLVVCVMIPTIFVVVCPKVDPLINKIFCSKGGAKLSKEITCALGQQEHSNGPIL
jgi:hypothetical protein